jgi:hypothetical protein
MAKPCGCGSKKNKRVASFSPAFIVKNAAGELVKEFGNKAQAVREVNRHPGYVLHPVENTQSA